jgi:putative ABC transport system permease protein
MFRHNLIIIFRNFKRNKSTFLINLIGLSTGLACALLIYLWVNDELHEDKWSKNDSRLYQVMDNQQQSSGIVTGEGTPDLLADALADEIPEVQYAAAVTPSSWFGNFTLTSENKNIKTVGEFAGKNFFNVFTYDLLQGNPDEILSNNNSIVISEALAERLFGTAQKITGKSIQWQLMGFKMNSVISGIFKGIPANSNEKFDFVLSYDQWIKLSQLVGRTINWGNYGPNTYIVLKNNTNAKAFNNKIAGFIKAKDKYSNVTLFMRPYSDAYLYNKYENGIQSGGRIEYVKLFSLIAVFILIIACINFMNLSTAKASVRMKEVGIKKTIGASRKSLALQHLNESLLLAFLSFFVSLALVEFILPQFNLLTGKHLFLHFDRNAALFFSGIIILTGLISGSYPALYLSGFSPVAVLKGRLDRSSKGELLIRKGLVVFQFALSIILMAAVIVVSKQMEYIQQKNLGYNKDNVIYFDLEGKVPKHQDAFFSELKQVPGVVNASSVNQNMIGINSTTYGLNWEGKAPGVLLNFVAVNINYDMLKTLDIQMKEGRTFSKNYGTDTTTIIFNQSAINAMGMKNPVGKIVNLWGVNRQIIGVTNEFNFESLHEPVKPLFFILQPNKTLLAMARIKAGMEKETLDRIKEFYQSFNPGFSFDYKFLDKDYQALYSSEERVSVLSRYFAGMAIIISCLGLFGLSAFTAERRKKEIGIRKVLGSSEFGIITLLSGDFTRLVFTAIIIALPLSYLVTKNWLDSFAYRINLQLWFFIAAGVLALLITWITVGTQAIKASMLNPSECLRNE